MEPSTWKNTNQHWFPRFLLKGFGQKRQAYKVLQLNCETNEIQSRNVEEVVSKPNLLSTRDDNLLHGIENKASETVMKIRRGRDINEAERRNLDALVWAMVINDPYHGVKKAQVREEVVEEMSQELIDAFRRARGAVNRHDVVDMVDQILNDDYLSHAMVLSDASPPLILRNMGLRAFQPPSGEFFVIGDSPVIVIRDGTHAERSLTNPGSQIILPIGHSRLLVYDWSTPSNVVTYEGSVSLQQVHTLDQDYRYHLGCGFLYGRNEASLMRSGKSHVKRLSQSRSKAVHDGWAMTQVELDLLDRSRIEWDRGHQAMLGTIARSIVEKAVEQRRNGRTE